MTSLITLVLSSLLAIHYSKGNGVNPNIALHIGRQEAGTLVEFSAYGRSLCSGGLLHPDEVLTTTDCAKKLNYRRRIRVMYGVAHENKYIGFNSATGSRLCIGNNELSVVSLIRPVPLGDYVRTLTLLKNPLEGPLKSAATIGLNQLGFSTIKFESVIRSNEKYYYVRSNQCDIAHYCKHIPGRLLFHNKTLVGISSESSLPGYIRYVRV